MKNRHFYNVKEIYSGDRVEVYKYSVAQEYNYEGNNKAGRKGKGKSNVEKNRKETLNKARNNIIRLINCNPDLTTFVTLTYAENMQDLQHSKYHLKVLFKNLQADFKDFRYLYVLEFQSRGAIHYHMLCNLPVPVITAGRKEKKTEEQKNFENYFREMYWEHGFVDIRDLAQEGNTNVGLYVAVYLVEDLYKLDLGGARCYGYSRNLNRPQERKALVQINTEKLIENYSEYDLKYASNYNMAYEKDGKIINGNINYFDMYKRDI